jgi:ABC-type polar amino acid transport system ATPase subunit
MLIAREISKSFGNSTALSEVSLEICPGKITALIGPNGCGKSTLLRALSLLEPPDSGEISVAGHIYRFPSVGSSPAAPWPDLTVVFQQLFLWPHLSVYDNITLALRHGHRRSTRKVVDDLIDRYEMSGFVRRFPNEISLGQRQRVAIARALALEPKYLLLDEVTSALDVEQTSSVLSHLGELKRNGTAILLVTHLIGFAKRAADQVVFLWDGSVEESGGPESLSTPTSERLAKFLALLD